MRKKKKRTLEVEVVNETDIDVNVLPGDTFELRYRDRSGEEHEILKSELKEKAHLTQATIFKMGDKTKIGYGGLFEGEKRK